MYRVIINESPLCGKRYTRTQAEELLYLLAAKGVKAEAVGDENEPTLILEDA